MIFFRDNQKSSAVLDASTRLHSEARGAQRSKVEGGQRFHLMSVLVENDHVFAPKQKSLKFYICVGLSPCSGPGGG